MLRENLGYCNDCPSSSFHSHTFILTTAVSEKHIYFLKYILKQNKNICKNDIPYYPEKLRHRKLNYLSKIQQLGSGSIKKSVWELKLLLLCQRYSQVCFIDQNCRARPVSQSSPGVDCGLLLTSLFIYWLIGCRSHSFVQSCFLFSFCILFRILSPSCFLS